MATAKTGSFYLNETIIIPAGTLSGERVSGTLDLSAYVNVPTGQAIAIDEVDFIWQVGTDKELPVGHRRPFANRMQQLIVLLILN